MKKVAMLSSAFLLIAGVAVAGEVTQTEKKVQKEKIYSNTMQDEADHTRANKHESTTVEKRQQTTTENDMNGDTTTREVEVEKKRSQTTTSDDTDSVSPGSTQGHSQKTETYHQHTTKEVK